MVQMLDEFTAFLHDGEVGGEVGIEDIVKAHTAESCDHALCCRLLAGQTEALAPCCTDSGCDLDNGDLFGIGKSGECTLSIVTLTECSGGAMGDALSAESAVGFLDGICTGNVYADTGTGIDNIPDMKILDLIAGLDAAHALDALALIMNEGEFLIPIEFMDFLLIVELDYSEVFCNLLKLAVAAAHAVRAVAVMLRKDELNIYFPCFADSGRIGVDNKAVYYIIIAGCDKPFYAFDLNYANAARTDLVKTGEIAESRNIDACAASGVQDRSTLGYGNGDAVNNAVYHFLVLPPLNTP